MQDFIILGILAAIVIVGVMHTVNHFKGKGSCCGGGNTYISKKRLKKTVATKIFIVEGMTCENCAARVLRYVNDIDGVAGKVNLKKKELRISMDRQVADQVIIDAVLKAGYEVI